MDVHSRSHRDQLATENEELRDLCCYLDDDRQRLKQSNHEWKDRYYQFSFKHKYRCCGAISRQRSTELKETAKQLYHLKVQVEADLRHHYSHCRQGSSNTQGTRSGTHATCELILLDNLIAAAWQELVQTLQAH